jgi:hypothetical protein
MPNGHTSTLIHHPQAGRPCPPTSSVQLNPVSLTDRRPKWPGGTKARCGGPFSA